MRNLFVPAVSYAACSADLLLVLATLKVSCFDKAWVLLKHTFSHTHAHIWHTHTCIHTRTHTQTHTRTRSCWRKPCFRCRHLPPCFIRQGQGIYSAQCAPRTCVNHVTHKVHTAHACMGEDWQRWLDVGIFDMRSHELVYSHDEISTRYLVQIHQRPSLLVLCLRLCVCKSLRHCAKYLPYLHHHRYHVFFT